MSMEFNLIKRQNTLNKYHWFLYGATFTEETNKKKLIIKKRFLNFLLFGASRIFDDEEIEYNCIGKYGRGIWVIDTLKQAFNEDEILIIREIAMDYGAFDY